MVVTDQLQKLRERLAAQGLARTASYLMFTVLGERAGFELNAWFRLSDRDAARAVAEQSFSIARDLSDFNEVDLQVLREYGGAELIERFVLAFSEGEFCVVGRSSDALAAICWAVPQHGYGGTSTEHSLTVERCFTLPEYRGQGFFPNALTYLRSELPYMGQPPVFIEASIFNQASVRGITKSGFERVGTKLSWHGREAFIPVPRPRMAAH